MSHRRPDASVVIERRPTGGTRPVLRHWRRPVRFIPLTLSQLGRELNRRSGADCGARAASVVDVRDEGANGDAGRRPTRTGKQDHGCGPPPDPEWAPPLAPTLASRGSASPRFAFDIAPPGAPPARFRRTRASARSTPARRSGAHAGGRLRPQSISCAGVRSGAPVGAARRYCAGHAMGRPSSRAARSGQYGSRSISRASRTRSAWPAWMI